MQMRVWGVCQAVMWKEVSYLLCVCLYVCVCMSVCVCVCAAFRVVPQPTAPPHAPL